MASAGLSSSAAAGSGGGGGWRGGSGGGGGGRWPPPNLRLDRSQIKPCVLNGRIRRITVATDEDVRAFQQLMAEMREEGRRNPHGQQFLLIDYRYPGAPTEGVCRWHAGPCLYMFVHEATLPLVHVGPCVLFDGWQCGCCSVKYAGSRTPDTRRRPEFRFDIPPLRKPSDVGENLDQLRRSIERSHGDLAFKACARRKNGSQAQVRLELDDADNQDQQFCACKCGRAHTDTKLYSGEWKSRGGNGSNMGKMLSPSSSSSSAAAAEVQALPSNKKTAIATVSRGERTATTTTSTLTTASPVRIDQGQPAPTNSMITNTIIRTVTRTTRTMDTQGNLVAETIETETVETRTDGNQIPPAPQPEQSRQQQQQDEHVQLPYSPLIEEAMPLMESSPSPATTAAGSGQCFVSTVPDHGGHLRRVQEALARDGVGDAELVPGQTIMMDLLREIASLEWLRLYGQADEGLQLLDSIRTVAYVDEATPGLLLSFLSTLMFSARPAALSERARAQWERFLLQRQASTKDEGRTAWLRNHGFPLPTLYRRLVVRFNPNRSMYGLRCGDGDVLEFNTLEDLRQALQPAAGALQSSNSTERTSGKKKKRARTDEEEEEEEEEEAQDFHLEIPSDGLELRLESVDPIYRELREERRADAWILVQLRSVNSGHREVPIVDPFQQYRAIIVDEQSPERDSDLLERADELLRSAVTEDLGRVRRHMGKRNQYWSPDYWLENNYSAIPMHLHDTLTDIVRSASERNAAAYETSASIESAVGAEGSATSIAADRRRSDWDQMMEQIHQMAFRVTQDRAAKENLLAEALIISLLPLIELEQRTIATDAQYREFARSMRHARRTAAQDAVNAYDDFMREVLKWDDTMDEMTRDYERLALNEAIEVFGRSMNNLLGAEVSQLWRDVYLPAGVDDVMHFREHAERGDEEHQEDGAEEVDGSEEEQGPGLMEHRHERIVLLRGLLRMMQILWGA